VVLRRHPASALTVATLIRTRQIPFYVCTLTATGSGRPLVNLRWDERTSRSGRRAGNRLSSMGFPDQPWMTRTEPPQSLFAGADRLWLLPLVAATASTYVRMSGTPPHRHVSSSTSQPAPVDWFRGLLRRCSGQAWRCSNRLRPRGCAGCARTPPRHERPELHTIYSLLFHDVVASTPWIAGHGMCGSRRRTLGGQRPSAQMGRRYKLSAIRRWAQTLFARPLARPRRVVRSVARRGWLHSSPARPRRLYSVRWAQFGALSTAVRFHGTTSRRGRVLS